MPDDYWKLVEPIWDEISIYDGENEFLKGFARAAERPRALFATHWTQSEVMNGGLGQYFSNSTGILAPEAVVAFKSLGMPRTAAALSDAMSFFGTPYPRDAAIREEVFVRFFEEHGEEAIPIEREEVLFATLIEEENGGFWIAADLYANGG